MVPSLLTKALVPAILLSVQYALAQGSCSKVDDVKLTFFGLGSAGVYTKFGCSGTSVAPGSESATVENAPHPSGGTYLSFPFKSPPEANMLTTMVGDGSYDNPALFATAQDNPNFKQCEIIYVPRFKKYFQYGDICEQCSTDYKQSGLVHVDLWIGPNPQKGWTDASIPDSIKRPTSSCEMAWGGILGQSIVQNPPTNLEVQSMFTFLD